MASTSIITCNGKICSTTTTRLAASGPLTCRTHHDTYCSSYTISPTWHWDLLDGAQRLCNTTHPAAYHTPFRPRVIEPVLIALGGSASATSLGGRVLLDADCTFSDDGSWWFLDGIQTPTLIWRERDLPNLSLHITSMPIFTHRLRRQKPTNKIPHDIMNDYSIYVPS